MNDPLLTGISGVAVAVVTWLLAGAREKSSFQRDVRMEQLRKLESLYADVIVALEMSIRTTVARGSYEQVERDHSKNNVLLRLLSTKEINDQYMKVGDLLYQWSSLYKQGEPKPMGDSGFSIMKSGDSKFAERAKQLRPELDDQIMALLEMMSKHLKDRESARL